MHIELTERESVVLQERADGLTYKAIGAKYSVTRDRIRGIHCKARRKVQSARRLANLLGQELQVKLTDGTELTL